MSLTQRLDLLVDPASYPAGQTAWSRWGELLRSDAPLSSELNRLLEAGRLCRLSDRGRIRGGAVTRANAYFLVKELPFSGIPTRMRVTQADLRRIAVAEDGLGFLFRIERQFIKPVLKGPESLTSAFSTQRNATRLVDITASKADLEAAGANGALAYLRRGETTSYKVSSDDLKGGVPAERSQIRNRRPFWYSIQGTHKDGRTIVFPEHIDKRYVFTLTDKHDDSVVIDKLFVFEAADDAEAAFIHACLNSLLGWYQVELRGRSQLGEGVLELKIPDYGGIMIPHPSTVSKQDRDGVLAAFAQVPNAGTGSSLEELGSPERLVFDRAVLEACEFPDPDAAVIMLERQLRALAGERIERKHSVSDAKISRRKVTNVAATVDAHAARIAAGLPPFPDPREFVDSDESDEEVVINRQPVGPIEIGMDLFNLGAVLAGGAVIAQASSIPAATLVRAVLLIEPSAQSIRVPTGRRLDRASKDWLAASRRWTKSFDAAVDKMLAGVVDPRLRVSVREQALRLMHAA